MSCNRTQQSGKFCLDCGTPLKEVVTSGAKFVPIFCKRTSEQLKRDVRTWLGRIGVQQPDIKIVTNERDKTAAIEYLLVGKRYHFTSYRQKDTTHNLAAIEQFLHFRALSIEHGIETAEQAFSGYQSLPDPIELLKGMSDAELREELKRHHPDTGTGDTYQWEKLMNEKERRKLQ
jgi:hypothetical protein